jgi:hypothetical protein
MNIKYIMVIENHIFDITKPLNNSPIQITQDTSTIQNT